MTNAKYPEWASHLVGIILIFFSLSNNLGYEYMPKDPLLYKHWPLINILSLFTFTIMLAFSEANRDYKTMSEGGSVNHFGGAWRRAGMISIAIFLLTVHWTFVFSAFAVFSLVFNYFLNHKRGKRWDYVSTSNVYDKTFIKLFKGSAGMAKICFEALVALTALIA